MIETFRACGGCGVDVRKEDATVVEARTVAGTRIRSVVCSDCAKVIAEGKYPGVSMGADGQLVAVPSVPEEGDVCPYGGEHGCGVHCAPCDFEPGTRTDCSYHPENVHARALKYDPTLPTDAFMGKPAAYWMELDAHAQSLRYEGLIEEIAQLKLQVQAANAGKRLEFRRCPGCGGETPSVVAGDAERRRLVAGLAAIAEDCTDPDTAQFACRLIDGTAGLTPEREAALVERHPLRSATERILCAAVHFDDGKARVHQPTNIATGIVFCGRRHHNCFATAAEQGWCHPTQYWRDSGGKRPPSVQGFLTSADRFVGRAEAARIARAAGQVDLARVAEDDELISEDLY